MRILPPVTLMFVGLLGACADDGASAVPSDDNKLEERPGQLDQSTGKANEPGQVCPAIALAPDGQCVPTDRSVPCPRVDPDCRPAEPVACTLIWRLADGRCDLSDPCAKLQDEDCQDVGTPGCDPGGVICTAIRYADNGKCEAPKGCEQNDPVDCANDGGIACIEIRFADNGKCEAAKGCEYTDPVDCRRAQCLVAVPRDGKCPPPRDPCDPDC